MSDRRTFLRGLAKLPLIGGSLAIIGAPSAPVSLVQAATLAGIPDPRERARFAWEAFASAMDDVTAGTSGWRIRGAGRIAPCGVYQGVDFLNLAEVHFDVDKDAGCRQPLIIERHRDFALDPAEDVLIQAANARKAEARQARETRL